MFREMRRSKKLMTDEEAMQVLKDCNYGIVAVNGDDGYPYGVPVNYALYDGKIVFHSALDGHKCDAIAKSEKVCFTVVGSENILAEKFSTDFDSVVVFGKARAVTDIEEKKVRLMSLIEKYASQFIKEGNAYVNNDAANTGVFEIEIEDIKGKRSVN